MNFATKLSLFIFGALLTIFGLGVFSYDKLQRAINEPVIEAWVDDRAIYGKQFCATSDGQCVPTERSTEGFTEKHYTKKTLKMSEYQELKARGMIHEDPKETQ